MENNNSYNIVISSNAKQMLVSHAAFLAQVSPEAAKRLTRQFNETAKSLSFMPQRFSWLDYEYIPKYKYRYTVFEKRYMIIYQIIDQTVYIDYIVDTRQDYSWLIK